MALCIGSIFNQHLHLTSNLLIMHIGNHFMVLRMSNLTNPKQLPYCILILHMLNPLTVVSRQTRT
jgi:hypothetical protein